MGLILGIFLLACLILLALIYTFAFVNYSFCDFGAQ